MAKVSLTPKKTSLPPDPSSTPAPATKVASKPEIVKSGLALPAAIDPLTHSQIRAEDGFACGVVRKLLTPGAYLGGKLLNAQIKKETREQNAKLAAAGGKSGPVEIEILDGLPGVRNIRPEEELDFLKYRSPLYVPRMTKGVADNLSRLATGRQKLKRASDETLRQMVLYTALSHSLVREQRPGGEYFKLDLSEQLGISTFASSTFQVKNVAFPVDASSAAGMEVEMVDGKVYRPGDKDWERVKLYVQVAWAHALTGMVHTWVHFALPETAAAVLENKVPKDSTLYKLLAPHLRFTMRINHQALRVGRFSSNEENSLKARLTPWLSLPMTRDAFTGLIAKKVHDYYLHDEREPSVFPRKFDPAKPYDRFLEGYYECVRDFVADIADQIDPKDYEAWSSELAKYIPDVGKTNMVDMLASLIWQTGILHAADHYSGYQYTDYGLPKAKQPFNSDAARRSKDPARDLVSSEDVYKWRNAVNVFVAKLEQHPDLENRTMATDYHFADPKMTEANRRFLEALKQKDAELARRGEQFCPLEHLLQSICF